jgi:aryl-alcohol dehydrogenase-like predicted oxidoreductase
VSAATAQAEASERETGGGLLEVRPGESEAEALKLMDAAWKLGRPLSRCVLNSYSLLDREAEGEVLPLCAEHGLGFTPSARSQAAG